MSERIEALARKVAGDPSFLASALAVYARAENLSDIALAHRLGCPPAQLAAIRLCRKPRPDTPRFQQDVDRIAARFLIDGDIIAGAVRLAEALAALGKLDEEGGYLMAARDREEDDTRIAEEQDETP